MKFYKLRQTLLEKALVFALIPPLFTAVLPQVKANDAHEVIEPGTAPLIARHLPQPQNMEHRVKKTLWLTVTAYSSTVDQTDSDPFTAASGAKVHDGMLAHNGLAFGTKVRFPERFGDKIFVVEDRLHPRKGWYIADLWMPTREEAKQWGAPILKMEILEN